MSLYFDFLPSDLFPGLFLSFSREGLCELLKHIKHIKCFKDLFLPISGAKIKTKSSGKNCLEPNLETGISSLTPPQIPYSTFTYIDIILGINEDDDLMS